MKTYYKVQYFDPDTDQWCDIPTQYPLRQDAEAACTYLESQQTQVLVFFRVVQVQETVVQELRQYEFSM